jgi:hypothetical protein
MVRTAPFKPRILAVVAGAGLLFMLAGGCARTGTVSGKVTYKNEPVSGVLITFLPQSEPDQGKAFSAAVDAGGNYQVTGVPVGPVKIIIQASGRRPSRAHGKETAAALKRYPARYATPKDSDLTLTVAGGRQAHDIELKD